VTDDVQRHQRDQRDHSSDGTAGGLTRRQVLGIGAAVAGAAAAAPLLGAAGTAAAADPPPPPAFPVAPQGTTLEKTLVRGTPGTKGYRPVVVGPGEASLVRGDLLGGASHSGGTRTPVLTLSQLTDVHIIDAQSPARVEFLDRLNDPGSPGATSLPFQSAYRPQEMLTTHVAEAMVQALNSLAGGPVTGRPIDFTIATGDNADNKQYNELRWQIDLLDGNPIRPDSGSPTRWEGIGGKDDYDVSYWHPEGTPFLGKPDNYRAKYGFPTVPGLLDRCRAPFATTGLNTPWYTVFGNHDGLAQGTVPSNTAIDLIAKGVLKPYGLPNGVDVNALLADLAAGDPNALTVLLDLAPARLVQADKNRRMNSVQQTVAEHFNTSGAPAGHGYTQDNVAAGTAYYTFDPAPNVLGVALDSCNIHGYDTGSLDRAQFDWLAAQLQANSARYLDATGNWVTGSGADKLMVIFSHHTVGTMTNPLGPGRVLGPEIVALLLRFPNVVLWVNGHTHRNTVTPYSRPSGVAVGGGFWEVNTAAHVDWPQQSRVLEIVDNGDDTLSIFGTIVDHAAPASWPAGPSTALELAALSRELGMNDPQGPPQTATEVGRRGALADRNVELLVRAPFPVASA
jgi:metallophosphoesterase (TIGR03767 family)